VLAVNEHIGVLERFFLTLHYLYSDHRRNQGVHWVHVHPPQGEKKKVWGLI